MTRSRATRFLSRPRTRLLLALVGCFQAPVARTYAQAPVLAGQVVESGGRSVPAAVVRATAAAGGATRTAVADSAGRYRLALPEGGGPWELRVERVGFYGLTVEIAAAAGQPEIRRDVQLTARVVELAPLMGSAARPVNRPPAAGTPGGQDEASLAVFDLEKPVVPGDLTSIAALQPGVLSLGGGALSIAGQPPSQNGITLDGASFGALSLPAEALRSTAVARSTYDPSRGQFSGGQIAATTLSGTNYFGGAARLGFSHPALQAAAPARAGDSDQFRHLQFSGGAGGPLTRDRLFWYVALQATRRSTPLVTLPTAGGSLLRGLGVDPDSARRLREIVSGLGYPTARSPLSRGTDAAAAMLRLDWVAGKSHVAMTRFDARGTRLDGLGESPLAVSGGGSESREGSAGAMAQLTSYLGSARNELRVYRSAGARRSDVESAGPGAAVRVASAAEDGAPGEAVLRFGGGLAPIPESDTELLEIADDLILTLPGEHNRARLGFVASRERFAQRGAADPFGSFTFASLADLERGRPARFTRSLGEERADASTEMLGAYAAHLWQPHRDWALVYGLRLEGRRYRAGAAADDGSPALFGLHVGKVAPEWGVSPRAGFRYDAPSRTWSVRGGMGEFRGRVPPPSLAAALSQTGAARETTLECVGPAAPTPEWARYAADPRAIPTTCADGTSVFGVRAARATVFARDFAAPRAWRATLGWSADVRSRLGMLGVAAEGSWARGLAQTVANDLNLTADGGFALADEGGRAVLAPPASIDPLTGGIAPAATRVLPSLGPVREVSARGRSTTLQLTLGTHLLTPRLSVFGASYTLTYGSDWVGSLAAPGAYSEPLSRGLPGALAGGSSDLERRHLLQAHWSRPLHRWSGELSLAGRIASGAPFTPRVEGDVNGDGQSNDAAYIFDPAAMPDPLVARVMAELLRSAPAGAAECLHRQLGTLARRNSCRGPWTGEMNVQAAFWPGQDHRSRRFTVTATLSNVLAGADRLLHGTRGGRGWGQAADPDPTLLYVRGFDPDARAFRYGVNPAFGSGVSATRAATRQPFALLVQGRWTFGADPVRQPLTTVLSTMRVQGRTPAELREALSSTVPNLPAQVLALGDSARLDLSVRDREALRAAADAFGRRVAPLVDSLAQALSTAESTPDRSREKAAREEVERLSGRAQAALEAAVAELRALLSPTQWERLPAAVQRPSRQILPSRGGFTISTGEPW